MTTLRVPVLALAATALVGGGFAAGMGVMQLSDSAPSAQSVVLAGASVSGSSATSVPCPVTTSSPTKKPTATTSPTGKATKSAAPTASPSKAPAGKTPAGKAGWVVDGFAALGAGTTGGAAGETVTVTTTAALTQYAGSEKPFVIKVSGLLTVSGQIKVAANKTIVGVGSGSGLTGGGLNVRKVKNVIIANLTISKAKGTDAISVFGSDHVLVTHNDLSSDLSHGKDFYDGLVDITQGSDDVTVSFNRFHDHFKVVLIGHSDNNGALDTGKLHVTLHHNSFTDVGSRLPSLRFGTGHVYNNVFTNVATSAIHSRMGAVILAQNNVFTKVKNAYVTNADSKEPGTILTDPSPVPAWPYSFTLDATSKVAANVTAQAGPK
ncbi:MAG TPA: right-handed parallel beta-helix repeat-containing protein [Kineosporiaceae bacterium]|nr:right-handed parallel beta-helix repeat-containing protein [Kineosporiaceae bacterium]